MKHLFKTSVVLATLVVIMACNNDFPDQIGVDGEWQDFITIEPTVTDNLSYKVTLTTTFDVNLASNEIESGGFEINGDLIAGNVRRSGKQIRLSATCTKLDLGTYYDVMPYLQSEGKKFFKGDNWGSHASLRFENSAPNFSRFSDKSLRYKLNATSLDVYVPVYGNVETSGLEVTLVDRNYKYYPSKPGILCVMYENSYYNYGDFYIKATFDNGEFPNRIYKVIVDGYNIYSSFYPDWSI